MYAPIQSACSGMNVCEEHIQEISCYKADGRWYIGLSDYIRSKGQQAYIQLGAFTDDLISWIARKRNRFTVLFHTLPFEGARKLVLDELCTGPEGGAYYRLISGSNRGTYRLWVCDTSLLVFGDLPPQIFFRFDRKDEQQN